MQSVGFTALDFTNAGSTFQFYGLARLWGDIRRAIDNELPLAHLAPEPLRAGEVYRALIGEEMETRSAALYHEDMRTRHATIWGGTDGYISGRADVLAALRAFYREARPA